MSPGLIVKLRPIGPWRIGPDSGARNRVDVIYHSDSLYSAVTAAMARLGVLKEWLDATARESEPAVCFSSCFPYLERIRFVVPPRTVWPPFSPSAMSARVRWKSARFVPLEVVQSTLAKQPLDDVQWNVDGPSECLVPAGRPGPFRTSVRWSAAVDRLTGATERHSTACIEFRPEAGLWLVVSFRDEAAHARWAEPVKGAFRLLADTGFGGERSRGWGRSEAPEFIEGKLPEMILPPPVLSEAVVEASAPEPESVTPTSELEPAEELTPESARELLERIVDAAISGSPEPPAGNPRNGNAIGLHGIEAGAAVAGEPQSSVGVLEMEAPPEVEETPAVVEPVPAPLAEPLVAAGPGPRAHWLLSLFTPAKSDAVDWRRGNYAVLARGGRVESPAGSGELKKQVQMVAEGSVLYAETAPRGSAADVAPDGFAHPVYRAGFALAIQLPEVR
ncbi:MAG TPA: hypothetical protein VLY04_20745 [Bryobacteraceae bacterium]|nr:hypothetical protein [Bryobacteraceae bacterium]